MLTIDRVQAAISKIVKVEEQIRTPKDAGIAHPILLIKEAEQQVVLDRCVICGHNGADLEQHHVAGRRNFSDTTTLCKRCHGQMSEIYQPKWIHQNPPRLECYFLGWSDIFHLLWQKTRDPYFLELSKVFAQNARYVK